jgi:hypothetical protein
MVLASAQTTIHDASLLQKLRIYRVMVDTVPLSLYQTLDEFDKPQNDPQDPIHHFENWLATSTAATTHLMQDRIELMAQILTYMHSPAALALRVLQYAQENGIIRDVHDRVCQLAKNTNRGSNLMAVAIMNETVALVQELMKIGYPCDGYGGRVGSPWTSSRESIRRAAAFRLNKMESLSVIAGTVPNFEKRLVV